MPVRCVFLIIQPACCRPWRCWSVPRCTRWKGFSTCAKCVCARTFRACPVESWHQRASAWFDSSAGQRWGEREHICWYACSFTEGRWQVQTFVFVDMMPLLGSILSVTMQSSCMFGSSTLSPTTTWSSATNQISWSSQVSTYVCYAVCLLFRLSILTPY